MIKKVILSALLFYFLTLLETSFLIHFSLYFSNLILILIILINLLENRKENFGLICAFFGGFFSDIFSDTPPNFIGFHVLTYILISVFIKYLFKKHVQFF